ncbi:MAG TPA: BlaI/MecI/CopY family transcriptional regulator [Firmicutes bacterium]|nr:BlaI/MecI/CopY family transcriptional regulator [Candidatus Fermentithermobacillaceae bacterium]
MSTVWSIGRCTVREVYERLRSDRNLAYTTVMTVMSRLATKGLLKRELVDGSYYYEPAMSQEEFKKTVVSEVLDGLLDSFSEQTIAHLVSEISKRDDAKLEQLEKVIAELRKGKGRK